MTLLVLAVGPDGARAAASALDAGLRELGGPDTLLVLRDDRVDAEAFTPLIDDPQLAAVRERFDRTVSLNATLGWVHPRRFVPRGDSVHVFAAMLQDAWGLAAPLVVAAPADDDDEHRLLWHTFPTATLAAYGIDGELELVDRRRVRGPRAVPR